MVEYFSRYLMLLGHFLQAFLNSLYLINIFRLISYNKVWLIYVRRHGTVEVHADKKTTYAPI